MTTSPPPLFRLFAARPRTAPVAAVAKASIPSAQNNATSLTGKPFPAKLKNTKSKVVFRGALHHKSFPRPQTRPFHYGTF